MKLCGMLAVSSAFGLMVAGCKSYERMDDISLDDIASTNAQMLTISSLADAAKVALVGNPELNILRLKAAGSEKLAKESGWWEDPQFGFDLMRIVNPSEHPFLGGGALGFTIPLFGTKNLESDIASARKRSFQERVVARECEVAVESRKTAIDYFYAAKMVSLVEGFGNDKSIGEAVDKAIALYKAGECQVTDVNSILRRRHECEHLLMELRRRKNAAETEFRRLAGLCPQTEIRFDLEVDITSCRQTAQQIEAERLLSHPLVKAELSLVEVSELEFKLQIRKQYPELSIGPQFGNEEGSDRLGFNMGLTLPIWNRNRLSVAEADLERQKDRATAVEVWRSLVLQASADNMAYVNLYVHEPAAAAAADSIRQLYAAGELGVVAYLGEREEILRQALSEMEWENDLAVKRNGLRKYDLTIFE